jgi:ureidoglycolate hydrolase
MKYEVVIYETVWHKLVVSADHETDALELAYELVSNRNPDELEADNEYSTDAEYDNYYEVKEKSDD